MYLNDPFFKEKVDWKIMEAQKRISKNPGLASAATTVKDLKSLSSKLNKTLEDHEFV